MRSFDVQDSSCLSPRRTQNGIIQETLQLLPSGSIMCWLLLLVASLNSLVFLYHIIIKAGICLGGASGLEIISQSEQQRELPEEEPGVKYSMPSFDQVGQKRNTAKEKVRMNTSIISAQTLLCQVPVCYQNGVMRILVIQDFGTSRISCVKKIL